VMNERGRRRFAVRAGDPNHSMRRKRRPSLSRTTPMSPIKGTFASRARAAIGGGSMSTPGETTTPRSPVMEVVSGSRSAPCRPPRARASSRLSHAMILDLLAASASTVASPERARPRTA
jgi:hypothetical protein